MSLLTCDDGAQPAEWCPSSPSDAAPSVFALLPPGPAWDAVQDPDSVLHRYWLSISDIVAWTYQLLCLYLREFFCDTVDKSLDQWVRCYALGQDCDPFGYNLCAKVTAVGGANCSYMVDIARASGIVITCESLADRPQPIAGCFLCGCTPLGPTPTFIGTGANLGYGDVCACRYGEIVHHPEPQYWDTTRTSLALCYVPGSDLGQSSGAPGCCFICGYYTVPDVPVPPLPSHYCVSDDVTIVFPPVNVNPIEDFERFLCGEIGSYINYGDCFVWLVTIDIPASRALQGLLVDTMPQSNAGNLIAGCTPLCYDPNAGSYIECLLNSIKPAHTELVFEVIQP